MDMQVGRMVATLAHRGPDDQASWVDGRAGIALASRRLAIIDVSPNGRMPMRSASGRYVIAYNGEVYNAGDIARTLERAGAAPAWRGHSDTEIILAAFEAWGLEPALKRFNGMFAFALWDTVERTLHLVRDRLGIKPLYVGQAGEAIVFGSELRALARHPSFVAELDREWLDDYLRGPRIQTERTVYSGVHSVPPGTYLMLRAGQEPRNVVYWSAVEQANEGRRQRFDGTDDEAIDALDALLSDAVRIQLVSDVPLGVLLSGGIDSATVLALSQAASTSRIRSFSIGFPQTDLDEAPHARAIAEHLGAEHTELYVEPGDMLELIPSLARTADMPISDPSWVSNYFAYRLAGQQVTVALAGDGGDEVFGGYHRHRWLPRVWRSVGKVPAGIRSSVGHAIDAIPPGAWDRMFAAIGPVLPAHLRERTPGAKLHRLARWIGSATPEQMYGVLASRWDRDDHLVVDQPPTFSAQPFQFQELDGEFALVERILAHELNTYLPDSQLIKVDRASMAVSVEARVPLLDHRVVEMALRLPPALKVRGERGKYALRQVLYRRVPPALFERPKMGFHLPLATWLRGPLRPWAEDLLQVNRLRHEGIFRLESVLGAWNDHVSGRHDRSQQLWPVLMFQSWRTHDDG
jgi:asparagine synthase (glutamine-hydrolysing)